MRIVLIGFMGSGKTTVAKLLGEKLPDVVVVDMDQEILATSGFSNVPKLFSEKGEAFFRECELQAATQLKVRDNVVISPGGGVVDYPATMKELLANNSVVFYLYTPFASVVERIGYPTSRPLFADTQKAQTLYTNRQERYAHYAHFTIDTTTLTPQGVAAMITTELSRAGYQLRSA